MNTKEDWLTTARIRTDSERADHWRYIFGGDELPVLSPLPDLVGLPDGKEALAYRLDLKAITDDQRRRLTQSIAVRFGIDPAEVERNLDSVGCPVLAADVTVTCADRGLFFSMLPDFDMVSFDDDLDGWEDDDIEDWEEYDYEEDYY